MAASENNSATIDPSTSTFDKKLSEQENVTTTITWNDAENVTLIEVDGSPLENNTDYKITDDDDSNATLIILKEYLSEQDTGNIDFSIFFNVGDSSTFTITIEDSTESATIAPSTSTFDKKLSEQENVTTTITWNDAENVTLIEVDGSPLENNTDYKITDDDDSNATLIILKEYLSEQDTGNIDFSIFFNVGDFSTFTITIEDSTPKPATIEPTNANFDRDKPEDLITVITWNDAENVTLIEVDGSPLENNTDYKITDDDGSTATLTILKEYLNKQDTGDIELLIDFDIGEAKFTITIHPKGYSTGNRIWDADHNLSLKYEWNAKSFSGFYYDLDTGMSSESMTIELLDYNNRRVDDGNLRYITEPVMTGFEYGGFGDYQVIGFMADRYFAGYTAANTTFLNRDVSMMADGQLSKVLIDTDDRRSVFTGSSLVLEDGYVINIVEIDVSGDRVFLTLSRDGREVDSAILSSGDIYVYERDIGHTDDVPVIAARISSVFRGTETNAVFIEGIFQISDDYVSIEQGEKFGRMEISSISETSIEMRNDGSFNLRQGTTIDIMGDLKFIVADSGTIRFAPFVDITEPGVHEIRGTVAENEGLTWTPLNFEGFYYDIDEGLMTESLELDYSGRSVGDGDLRYETVPALVSFEQSNFGSYEVIGFMAEKYFAGYTAANTTFLNRDVSMMADGQLSKVLLDNDNRRTLYTGSSLVLEEGYVLRIQEIDLDGNNVLVSLTKDGSEVDSYAIVGAGQNYVYERDLGSADDVPIIIVKIDSIFRGTETNAIFIGGIFQISDDYQLIETGDKFGKMEVDSITENRIVMTNDGGFSLSRGSTIDIMGDIKFKVADDHPDVRYYPFVERTIAGDSLDLDMPSTAVMDSTLTITVTSRGAGVEDVNVRFGGENIGTTDRDGELRYIPTEAGTFTVEAQKTGYISATGNVEVISPDDEDRMMSIEVSPETIYEGSSMEIRIVTAIGAEPMEGVEVFYDGNSMGLTDEDGTVDPRTAREPGMHKITAYKEGYLEAERNIEVIALEADFEFSNLVISPEEVRQGRDVTISVDVENTGTAEGEYNVDLMINGNVTDTKLISLGVGNSTTLEFVHTAGEPGNYTVNVNGLEGTFEVIEGRSIFWYVLGVLIIAGAAGTAYMFTAGGWTVEMLRARLMELTSQISEMIDQIRSR
ncbi:S-layer protein domain-containing protein [Methanosalsum zhilinae]|nr:S-layer protein domain-containing protein [Methanosalsum zhilinae]